MNNKAIGGSIYYLKRLATITHEEGLLALLKRILKIICPSLVKVHLLVLGYEISCKDSTEVFINDSRTKIFSTEPRVSISEIKKISEYDEADIDALTEIDEWKISKTVTLQNLRDGWYGYVAKKGDEIIATGWSTQAKCYYDPYLKREFEIDDEEAYFWRGFCVPAYRGSGVIPYLVGYMVNDLSASDSKSKFLMIVRKNNYSIIKSMNKIGWKKVGITGFIEIFGLRLHYLMGRGAFKNTRKGLCLLKG